MPDAAQKLASQLGDVWMVQAYPITATGFEPSELAHAQGLYSGITYATGGAPAAAPPLLLFQHYYRRRWGS